MPAPSNCSWNQAGSATKTATRFSTTSTADVTSMPSLSMADMAALVGGGEFLQGRVCTAHLDHALQGPALDIGLEGLRPILGKADEDAIFGLVLNPEPGKGGRLLLGQLGVQRANGFLQRQPAHGFLQVEAILGGIGLGILGQGIVERGGGLGGVGVKGRLSVPGSPRRRRRATAAGRWRLSESEACGS